MLPASLVVIAKSNFRDKTSVDYKNTYISITGKKKQTHNICLLTVLLDPVRSFLTYMKFLLKGNFIFLSVLSLGRSLRVTEMNSALRSISTYSLFLQIFTVY